MSRDLVELQKRFSPKWVFKNGYWEWISSRSRGRAMMTFKGKKLYASRTSYELYYGEIPEGLLVLHSCDNGMCVNPLHLFLGTQRDNVMDSIAKGRFKHMENVKLVNNIGRKLSEETRKNMSIARKKYFLKQQQLKGERDGA